MVLLASYHWLDRIDPTISDNSYLQNEALSHFSFCYLFCSSHWDRCGTVQQSSPLSKDRVPFKILDSGRWPNDSSSLHGL